MAGVKPGEAAAEVPNDSTVIMKRDERSAEMRSSPEIAPVKHKELSHA